MSNIPVGGVQIRDLPESGTLQSEDKFVIDRSNETMSVPASLLSEKTNATVSDAFDSAKEYSAGDYCIYNDVLYKFTSAKEVGVWDGDVVEATTIGEEVSELNTNMTPEEITLTYTTTDCTISSPLIYRIGRLVVLSMQVTSDSSSISEDIATFPEDCRPEKSVHFALGHTTANTNAYAKINASGLLSVSYMNSSSSNKSNVLVAGCFVIAQ